jgi:polyisoprenoid-binding protein YceI
MKHSSMLCALVGTLLLAPAIGAMDPLLRETQAAQAPSSLSTSSAVHVELQKETGSVEFFAVGWPSALKIHGKGTGADGEFEVTGTQVTGSIGFDLGSLETGIGLRDRHMKEKYLETSKFPRASLSLSHLETAKLPESGSFGAMTVPFEGVLSLHGVERPVTGEAKVSRVGTQVTGAATFWINLAEFGIDVPKYLGITVAEKVQVRASFSAALFAASHVAAR